MTVTVFTFTGTLSADNYVSVVNNTGTTTPSSGSVATNSSYGSVLLHCGFAISSTATTSSAASGFALRYHSPGNSAPCYGIAAIDQIGATGSVTPQITISSAVSWTANAVQFRTYTPLGNATGYTITTTPGGHQNAQVNWTVNLVGGDFAGTITGTPGGGISQCEIYYPVTVTFPGNGITSVPFQFTPLIVDSVTFTFTNSGSFSNPGPYNYVSTGEYLLDALSGSSGTAIHSHTSSTLPSGLTGTAWGTPSGGNIQLDGGTWGNGSAGGVFLESTGDSISYWPGTLPGAYPDAVSVGWFEVQFDFQRLSAVSGAGIGFVFLNDGTNGPYELSWNESTSFELKQNGTSQTGALGGPGVGQTWRIKIDLQCDATNASYMYINVGYSTNNGLSWTSLTSHGVLYSAVSQNPSAGIYGHGTAVTSTTGPHIGNVVLQDVTPPTPNCQFPATVSTPSGGTVEGAYITSCGTMLACFFQTISGGTQVTPTAMNYSPSIYKNGSFIGQGQNPWITGHHPCVLFQLPAGTSVASGDTVTISTPASWMTCGTGNAANGVTNYPIGNRVGRSNMGTETVTKTFKPGVNFSDAGSTPQTFYNLPTNWRYRLTATNDGTTYTPDGYPTAMHSTTLVMNFLSIPVANGLDSTQTPTTPSGYWAIGFDDTYIANSGTASQFAIVSGGGCTVTPITGNNNPGSGGLGQFYLFQVAPDGSGTANMQLALQITNTAKTPYFSNLWIVGPGDFTVPMSGVTNWTFPRPVTVAHGSPVSRPQATDPYKPRPLRCSSRFPTRSDPCAGATLHRSSTTR